MDPDGNKPDGPDQDDQPVVKTPRNESTDHRVASKVTDPNSYGLGGCASRGWMDLAGEVCLATRKERPGWGLTVQIPCRAPRHPVRSKSCRRATRRFAGSARAQSPRPANLPAYSDG